MPINCFECGVEVSESQKVVHNGRIYCSQAHATSPRQKPAPPRVKSATQPSPAQNPPSQAPAASPAAGPKPITKLGAAMKVRELVARLAKADPDDIVTIDTDAKCLLLLNQRPGMFQPLDENEVCAATLTECDKEFLRVLCVQF